MVSLGYVKDASQRPEREPSVILRRGGAQAPPTISARKVRRDQEVRFQWVAPAGLAPDAWCPEMARALADLRWRGWVLDARSVAEALGKPLTEGLTSWGLEFWKHYRKSCKVFIQIGEDGRDAVEAAVKAWDKTFTHIYFDDRLDIDRKVRQKAEELQGKPVRKTLHRFFPALFGGF